MIRLLTKSLYQSICSPWVSTYILRSTDWFKSDALRFKNDLLYRWSVISSIISIKSVLRVRIMSDKLNIIFESLNLNLLVNFDDEFLELLELLSILSADWVFKNPVFESVNSLWLDHFWFNWLSSMPIWSSYFLWVLLFEFTWV